MSSNLTEKQIHARLSVCRRLTSVIQSVMTRLRHSWLILFDLEPGYSEGLDADTLNACAAELLESKENGLVIDLKDYRKNGVVAFKHPDTHHEPVLWVVLVTLVSDEPAWVVANNIHKAKDEARSCGNRWIDTLDYLQAWLDLADAHAIQCRVALNKLSYSTPQKGASLGNSQSEAKEPEATPVEVSSDGQSGQKSKRGSSPATGRKPGKRKRATDDAASGEGDCDGQD